MDFVPPGHTLNQRLVGRPVPAGIPDPTRYMQVRSGRVVIVTVRVKLSTGMGIPGFTHKFLHCQYHIQDINFPLFRD